MTPKQILQEIGKLSDEERFDLWASLFEWRDDDEFAGYDDPAIGTDVRSIDRAHGHVGYIFNRQELREQLVRDFEVVFKESLENSPEEAKIWFEANGKEQTEAYASHAVGMFIARIEDAMAYMLVDHTGRIVIETIRELGRCGPLRIKLTDGQLVKNFLDAGNKMTKAMMRPVKQGPRKGQTRVSANDDLKRLQDIVLSLHGKGLDATEITCPVLAGVWEYLDSGNSLDKLGKRQALSKRVDRRKADAFRKKMRTRGVDDMRAFVRRTINDK